MLNCRQKKQRCGPVMGRPLDIVGSFFSLLIIFFHIMPFMADLGAGHGKGQDKHITSRCSEDGPAIKLPFWLKNQQPQHQAHPGFELSCGDRSQTVIQLPSSIKLNVKLIDYDTQQLWVYDPNGCLPKQLPNLNLSASPFQFNQNQLVSSYTLLNCSSTIGDVGIRIPCLRVATYIYAVKSDTDIQELPPFSCTKVRDVSSVPSDIFSSENQFLHLKWSKTVCENCKTGTTLELVLTVATLCSFILVVAAIRIYRTFNMNKREKENQQKIEKFLEDYRALKPTRYTYADIKTITNQFKNKLGQGAYGTVFTGKLSNEIVVAVKILNNYNGNGEEFVNEVGTMGRIHHVNVVRLVGFCAKGYIRALIYEFLPNHSLDKYIFSSNSRKPSLGWTKFQDIALGIARGIEYLHQGCNQRILHFDIKPHNILLDHNFNPKISDFGLVKLCSKENSAVSMTAARGTMGYIAPEMISRNIGHVSYKSDVYSFGMLLLEMVGGRKNIDVTIENTSQVYFPEWIYNHLDQGRQLQIRIEEEGDDKIAQKLTIVGLWCIQWHPIDRPSMKLVVQMLGGDNLTMPPNPFAPTDVTRTNARPLQQGLAVIPELE